MKSKLILLALCLATAGSLFGKNISLSGEWNLALDPENKGQQQGWQEALPKGSGSSVQGRTSLFLCITILSAYFALLGAP